MKYMDRESQRLPIFALAIHLLCYLNCSNEIDQPRSTVMTIFEKRRAIYHV